MKHLAYLFIAAFALFSGLATAAPNSINEQNQHYKNQQKQAEVKRQDTNRSVNNNAQQQRYNATRPNTAATAYKPPPPAYKPPATTTSTYNEKY